METFINGEWLFFRDPKSEPRENFNHLPDYIRAAGKGPFLVICSQQSYSLDHPQVITLGKTAGEPVMVSLAGRPVSELKATGHWLTRNRW
jgi:hypothetical protein